jgi:hypothetical protein
LCVCFQLENAEEMINASDLLVDAQQLPAPQDLRYAIFYLGAAQQAPLVLKSDILELRKKYIVQMDAKKSGVFDISFSNGVTAQMSTHPCYSYVPKSVHIDSISGIGGWGRDELQNVKAEANTNSMSSVHASVNFLLQILERK